MTGVKDVTTAREPGARERVLQVLGPEECLSLLEPGGIGRVGFAAADGVMMLPVNFAVSRKAVVFRTAPDSLLAVYANAQVSFEADHIDEAVRTGWSVLVHGHAHIVTGERDVRRLEEQTRIEPWADGARDVYVRVVPTRITGRRICA